MIRISHVFTAGTLAELQTIAASEGETATVQGAPYTYRTGVWVAGSLPPPTRPPADYSRLLTDTGTLTQPTLTIPAKGAKVTDPVFGTQILRLTDATDGVWNHTSYSYWDALNVDSSIVAFACDGVTKMVRFDPSNFAVVGAVTRMFAVGKIQLHWEGLLWSHLDPNIVYGWDDANRQRFYSFNISTGAYTPIFDLAALGFGPKEVIWQPSISSDDNRIAFTRNDKDQGKNLMYGLSVYDRAQNRIILDPPLTLAGYDECQLDMSGRWLTYKTTAPGRIFNVDTGAFYDIADAAKMVGHGDNGFGTMIGFEDWGGLVVSHDLASRAVSTVWNMYQAMPTPAPIPAIVPAGWPQDSHYSMRASQSAGVVLMETFNAKYPAPANYLRPYGDELLLLKLDGTGKVYRVCHHRTRAASYNDLPMASISQDGRWAVYTSNWGMTAGGRTDVFIVRCAS